jgi:aspartate 1-decarboxylase
MRSVLQAVIENAIVTHAGSSIALRIDPFILRAAEILPFERVEVVNVATRERTQTWAEPAAEGSGEVHVHTTARKGDPVTIVAFTHLHEGQTLAHKPKIVKLDGANKVVSVTELGR